MEQLWITERMLLHRNKVSRVVRPRKPMELFDMKVAFVRGEGQPSAADRLCWTLHR